MVVSSLCSPRLSTGAKSSWKAPPEPSTGGFGGCGHCVADGMLLRAFSTLRLDGGCEGSRGNGGDGEGDFRHTASLGPR